MKNRYCRNTKLSEAKFLSILMSYAIGMSAARAAKPCGENKRPASRQTIERIYLELGQYLHRRILRPISEVIAKKIGIDPAECEEDFLDHFWDIMVGDMDYAHYRQRGLPYFDPPKVVEVMRHRWKAFRGITRDKFAGHFAFVLLRVHDVESDTSLGTARTFEALKEMLQADPL